MGSKVVALSDHQLFSLCQQAAIICTSREFKQLHKEMIKLYRNKGMKDAKIVAFQDSLFSLYLEQHAGQSVQTRS